MRQNRIVINIIVKTMQNLGYNDNNNNNSLLPHVDVATGDKIYINVQNVMNESEYKLYQSSV